MNTYRDTALRLIEEQQAQLAKISVGHAIGEMLKEMAGSDAKAAELIAQDLEKESMSLAEAGKHLGDMAYKAYKAQETAGGGSYAMTTEEALGLVRKFYGIPDEPVRPKHAPISLTDLL